MFGKILKYNHNKIIIENAKKIVDTNYINVHVVFEDKGNLVVGEITAIDIETITILLIGEINNNRFSSGVLKKPSFNSLVRIIYKNELSYIFGNQDYLSKNTLLIGSSPIYNNFSITTNINDFFANHFAIMGNSGHGKSCGLARILQNVFFSTNSEYPKNAHICLFDTYGEYVDTFDSMNDYDELNYKKYTTQLEFESNTILTIPAYLLDADDLAILLNATSNEQLLILDEAIYLAKIFNSNDPQAEDRKNDIIARCLLDILSSGKNGTQLRDQIISVLTSYNTETLNLNSIIKEPGYTRTIKQCLNIDEQGKINSINMVVEFLTKFVKVEIEGTLITEDIAYTLNDLYYALELALINDGIYTSISSFNKNYILKSHLKSLISSPKNKFFSFDNYISKENYVINFFKNRDNSNCQLVNINISFVEDNFAKALTKILSKLFFNYTTSLKNRGSFPIHILIEEAHRYVSNDSDYEVLGYNIFDRITKEGRKYGTILGFITQRPSELSKTSLSQCANFIIFKLFYPDDLNIVREISSNVTDEDIEQIKILKPGMSLVFGNAFKVPLLVMFSLPNPIPISTSLKIDEVWYQ